METELQAGPSHPLVDEPHFNEEWTLLTARRVVPLSELKSHRAHLNHWKLVAGFAGAIVLGGLVGLASIRFTKPASEVASETEQPQSEQVQMSVPTPVETQEAQSGESETVQSEVANAPVKVAAGTRKSVRRNQTTDLQTSAPSVVDPSTTTAGPAATLVDQWQERRPRRVSVKPPRRDRDQNDLMRVDEIFEGSHPKSKPN
jgi:hypothetical protein